MLLGQNGFTAFAWNKPPNTLFDPDTVVTLLVGQG